MKSVTLQAPAKLNLTLDILGKRPDGYHDLKMVMVSVSLCDTVTVAESAEPGIRLKTNACFLPADGSNLAVKAANAFAGETGIALPGLDITLEKRIPVCAGTAGGSSDAAAVLRALNRMTGADFSNAALAKIGERVGSDVPYCVLGGTALAEGRGERLTPLPTLPHCYIVLCKPDFPISTPELFRAADSVTLTARPDTEGMLSALEHGDLHKITARLCNVFEEVLPAEKRHTIDEIRAELLDCGALSACMSGSGPTVYGIFDRKGSAEAAVSRLKQNYENTYLTEPV